MKVNGTTAATTVKPSFVSHMAESTTLSLLTSSAHEKDTWPSANPGMAIASLWSKILGKRADAEVTVLQLISAAKCHEHIWKSMWHFVLLKGGKQTRWCSTGWQLSWCSIGWQLSWCSTGWHQLRPLLQLGHLTDLAGLGWAYLLCKGQSNSRIGSFAMDYGYEWICRRHFGKPTIGSCTSVHQTWTEVELCLGHKLILCVEMAVYVSPMQQLACTFNCISSLWRKQRLSASGFSAFVLSLLHSFSCITPIEAFHKKFNKKKNRTPWMA